MKTNFCEIIGTGFSNCLQQQQQQQQNNQEQGTKKTYVTYSKNNQDRGQTRKTRRNHDHNSLPPHFLTLSFP